MNKPSLMVRFAIAAGLSLAATLTSTAGGTLQQPPTIAKPDAVENIPHDAVTHDAAVTAAGCCDGNCGTRAASAQPVCCAKKVTEKVKRHRWHVKPELVCIPGFRFECNWFEKHRGKDGKCCDRCTDSSGSCGCSESAAPTCGRVRCIKVLEKENYTCDECGYEWEVKCVRSGGRCQRSKCRCPQCRSRLR